MIDHVVMFSGGVTSWLTAMRVVERTGKIPALLFSDTLIEDDDLYRFVIEGAAHVLGIPIARCAAALALTASIPALGSSSRSEHLRATASEAMRALPGLHWIMDGRDPWGVFRDTRYIGNTRVAGCSHKLKQDTARAWLEQNCDVATTTIYVGLHWSEIDRFIGEGKSKGARELWLPWRCEAPLCGLPMRAAGEGFVALEAAKIRPPRLYTMGFSHNNCGGFCVRAGQAHFKRLLATLPDRYAHHEAKEQEMRDHLGKDVSILRDRRGGGVRPLTLAALRERIQGGAAIDEHDIGGCGCFITSDDADGTA